MCADHGPDETRFSNIRVALGFALSPLLPALLVSSVLDDPFYLVVSVYFGYPGVIILAVPAFFVVKRLRKLNLISCLVCGATLGSVEAIIVMFPGGIVIGAAFGLMFGLTFWLIAIAQWSDVLGSER